MALSRKLKPMLFAAIGAVFIVYADSAFSTIHSLFADLQQTGTMSFRKSTEKHTIGLDNYDEEERYRSSLANESSHDDENEILFKNQSLDENSVPPSSTPSKNQTNSTQDTDVSNSSQHLYNISGISTSNDAMMFVHVGKAGGMTLRKSTYLSCLGESPIFKPNPEESVTKCIEKFPPDAVLPFRLRYLFHLQYYRVDQMKDAAAFLFVLRHPVDRYVSAFYFHHPVRKTCAGCEELIIRTRKFYEECFPTIEDLAQMGVSPFNISNSTIQEQMHVNNASDVIKCHRVATAVAKAQEVNGLWEQGVHHFYFNYRHYATSSVETYQDKEVYVVRTEYEWQDLQEIDKKLGGSGQFLDFGNKYTHGSERFRSGSGLSTDGYHKLCCILVDEIEIYKSILLRAINLNEDEKQMTVQSVHDTCGVTTSWMDWKERCLATLEDDRRNFGTDNEVK